MVRSRHEVHSATEESSPTNLYYQSSQIQCELQLTSNFDSRLFNARQPNGRRLLRCDQRSRLACSATFDLGNSSTLGPAPLSFHLVNFKESDGNQNWESVCYPAEQGRRIPTAAVIACTSGSRKGNLLMRLQSSSLRLSEIDDTTM